MNEVIQVQPDTARTIERLWALQKMNLGPLGYYAALTLDSDPILAVGGANILLEQETIPDLALDRIIELSVHQSVQLRAFDYFLERYDHARARRVLDTPIEETPAIIKRLLTATYFQDFDVLYEVEIAGFYRTGTPESLAKAALAAESTGGWKAALPLLVSLILVKPQDAITALRLGRLLRDANQFQLLRRFCEIVDTIEIFPTVSALFRAALLAKDGQFAEGLKLLDKIAAKKFALEMDVYYFNMRAELQEKLGRPEAAYQSYLRQNKIAHDTDFHPQRFAEGVKARAKLSLPPPPPDPRTHDFLMLGFARSGTTLLDNVLSSHPNIETLEEIPSLTAAVQLYRTTVGAGLPMPVDFVARSRARYYEEIDRRKKKTGATIFVDKNPMASADAAFLRKIFLDKRYIFSIRHPFDVVLSCLKQPFNRNIAMDNFTTFDDSCACYDMTMTQWFSQFDLRSPEVFYLRYDTLVLDMKAEVTRVLRFLGTDWVDDVANFAERAEERKVKTPSYAKVRQGMSIGVQSSWRKYEFLFKTRQARLLDRWVAHFGYEGL